MTEKEVFTLSDGTEVKFNFSQLTRKEYNDLFDPAQSKEDGDKTINKITGFNTEQLDAMLQWDTVRLIHEVARLANRPDPT